MPIIKKHELNQMKKKRKKVLTVAGGAVKTSLQRENLNIVFYSFCPVLSVVNGLVRRQKAPKRVDIEP